METWKGEGYLTACSAISLDFDYMALRAASA